MVLENKPLQSSCSNLCVWVSTVSNSASRNHGYIWHRSYCGERSSSSSSTASLKWEKNCYDVIGRNILQAAFVLLDLGLAAGAAFGDEFGKMFALSLHRHPFIVASIIHPLRHVAAACWVMSLKIKKLLKIIEQINRNCPTCITEDSGVGFLVIFFKRQTLNIGVCV